MFQEAYMRRIVALVGVMGILALFAYTYSTMVQTKYMYQGPTSISVSGTGEVFAKPDIATFSFSVEAKEADATAAQNKANESMKSIVEYLTGAGIEEKDIKTGYYSLSPWYEYPEVVCTSWSCPRSEPVLKGYQVSQSVTVKVRDTAKAGELVSAVGDRGAMNVSGLSFTIDDEESLKAEARKLAIEDAKAKAEVLAGNLGARIVRMNGFWEEEGGPRPYAYGMGGDMAVKMDVAMAESSAPAELPTGENTISVRVNISYEIR